MSKRIDRVVSALNILKESAVQYIHSNEEGIVVQLFSGTMLPMNTQQSLRKLGAHNQSADHCWEIALD